MAKVIDTLSVKVIGFTELQALFSALGDHYAELPQEVQDRMQALEAICRDEDASDVQA